MKNSECQASLDAVILEGSLSTTPTPGVDARGQEGTERSLSFDRKIEVAVAKAMNSQRSLGVLHPLRADVLASAVIDLAARLLDHSQHRNDSASLLQLP